MPKKYQFKDEQKEEINNAYKASEEKREKSRLQALRLYICFNMPQEQISEIVLLSLSYIKRLISLYDNKGLTAILCQKQGGNHRNLTVEEERKLLEGFEESANQGQQISAKDIEKKYIETVGHDIGNSQIYYVLRRHGWRIVKPRKKHPESDPALQEEYKKNQLRDKRCLK